MLVKNSWFTKKYKRVTCWILNLSPWLVSKQKSTCPTLLYIKAFYEVSNWYIDCMCIRTLDKVFFLPFFFPHLRTCPTSSIKLFLTLAVPALPSVVTIIPESQSLWIMWNTFLFVEHTGWQVIGSWVTVVLLDFWPVQFLTIASYPVGSFKIS